MQTRLSDFSFLVIRVALLFLVQETGNTFTRER